MIKKIISAISIVLTISSCNSEAQIDKRKSLINKVTIAIEKYDTIQLYRLIDTSSYFKVQDKEEFLYQIQYVNSRFKECGRNIIDSNIIIREVPVNSKEYILPFCRGKDGNVLNNSFDLVFTFTDYDNDEVVHFINVNKSIQNTLPNKPVK